LLTFGIAIADLNSNQVDMSKLPKYVRWRPDFEAPGPHVTIEKKEGISMERTLPRDPDDDDDDEDFQRYRYYESDNILGKLYRAIDEREIFAEIQERSRADGRSQNSTVMYAVWEHVQRRCRLIQWEHKKEWARGIRDMCSSPSPSPYIPQTTLTPPKKTGTKNASSTS
jgi:hypothetical protein